MNKRWLISGSFLTIFGAILLFLSGSMEDGKPVHPILYGPRQNLFILLILIGLLIIFIGIFKKHTK
ncbi:MAG: hypothetical protein V1815_02940 [Candidatus Woesearchaeota archaeon]